MNDIELLCRCISLEGELRAEREHADRWQKLAGRYDDIRYWLRLCEDNPAGHAEFYRECCLLIFGEYRDESAS